LSHRIIDAEFAYAIPDEIPSEHAAPFMCAGASVYEALDAGSVKPSDRVGVVGLGGLGSMLILFAKAQGCAVTAISATGGNEDKIRSAFELGADEFRTATEADTRVRVDAASGEIVREEAQSEGINVLVICSNEVPDLKTIFPLLARRAVIVLMSISTKPLVVPYMDFILPGHKVRR
jgi:alcohol dehydrogenase (NADP+)